MDNKAIFYIGLETRNGERMKAKPTIAAIAEMFAAHGWINFSVVKQAGYWEGKKERSLAVTVLDNDGQTLEEFTLRAQYAAWKLAVKLRQNCIAVECSAVDVALVYQPAPEAVG